MTTTDGTPEPAPEETRDGSVRPEKLDRIEQEIEDGREALDEHEPTEVEPRFEPGRPV